MSEQTGLRGELIYQYTLQITKVVDYGISLDALFSGQTPPPAEGARFDVYFEGPVTGPKLQGTLRGVDYLNIRADGRGDIHAHAELATEDGKKIALAVDGPVIPEKPPVFQIRENVALTTNHPEYSWVNPIQVWGLGTVDVSKREIQIKAYAA